MMEPHATIARGRGQADDLDREPAGPRRGDRSRRTLVIPKENIQVVSAFVGGGFGGKLWIQSDAVLAALGARAIGRPVKVALAGRRS